MAAALQPTRAPRVSFTGTATAYVGNRQLSCAAANISASGMLLFPPERGRPGQFVRLLFCLAENRWLEADAVVVREATERPRYGWGVQFVQLAPHHRAELLRYLTARLGAVAAARPPAAPGSSGRGAGEAARRPRPDEFQIRDVTPFDIVEKRKKQQATKRQGFGNDRTPLQELYRRALEQLDDDDD